MADSDVWVLQTTLSPSYLNDSGVGHAVELASQLLRRKLSNDTQIELIVASLHTLHQCVKRYSKPTTISIKV